MMRILKILSVLIATILLACCSSPQNNQSVPNENTIQTDSSLVKENNDTAGVAMTSEITCPKCGHKKTETMPMDICLLKYTCEKCNTELLAKEGDCCVFCSYGNKKCPSMQ
jgi:hypothetical protein